jgi:hypothetical protein
MPDNRAVVFLAWLSVAPLPGCRAPGAPEQAELECAVWAEARGEVEAILQRTLRSHRLQLAKLQSCAPYRHEDWEGARDPQGRVRELARRAAATRAPAYGSFGCGPEVLANAADREAE